MRFSICDAISQIAGTSSALQEAKRAGAASWKVFRRPGEPMQRVTIVVARDRRELFAYFERVFVGMRDVKVLLGRRLARPRVCRGAQGRGRPAVSNELKL